MKSNKGITLISLVIYIVVATIVIGTMAMVSSFFFSNMNLVKDQDKYAVEFNKFNMFFIQDVKNNKTAEISTNQIKFADGTIYTYNSEEQSIYRNETKVAKEVMSASFAENHYKVSNTNKNLVIVNLNIGKKDSFQKEIEYVLKYW